MATVYAMV